MYSINQILNQRYKIETPLSSDGFSAAWLANNLFTKTKVIVQIFVLIKNFLRAKKELAYIFGARYYRIDHNYSQTTPCFEKTVNQGMAQSQFRLPSFYEHGYGIPTNKFSARCWYLKASVQKHEKAQKRNHELNS